MAALLSDRGSLLSRFVVYNENSNAHICASANVISKMPRVNWPFELHINTVMVQHKIPTLAESSRSYLLADRYK
jgi:hypothetical protein